MLFYYYWVPGLLMLIKTAKAELWYGIKILTILEVYWNYVTVPQPTQILQRSEITAKLNTTIYVSKYPYVHAYISTSVHFELVFKTKHPRKRKILQQHFHFLMFHFTISLSSLSFIKCQWLSLANIMRYTFSCLINV